jgi:hypothetical protein
MFDSKHYVPILRWKAAEKEALGKLSSKQKELITPLLEILMPQPNSFSNADGAITPRELLEKSVAKFKEVALNIPADILKYWGTSPAFIDLGLIDISLRAQTINQIIETGNSLGIKLIPVVSLNSDDATKKGVCSSGKVYGNGLCLRLSRTDFDKPTELPEKIKLFLKECGLSLENIDLLIDFKITDGQCSDLEGIIKIIPNLSDWRTFTFASGSFPLDLTAYTIGLNYIDRVDWVGWESQINSSKLKRKPAFADYTIQHPIYIEPAPGANPSASIRYTLKDKWMIMRGQGLRNPKSAGYAQYPANAQLLSKRQEFFGASFSYGDDYIENGGKDLKTKKTGNPRTWLRAGINHHLACTVDQISNLP